MPTGPFIRVAAAFVMLLAGIGLLILIRKKVLPKSTVLSGIAAIIVAPVSGIAALTNLGVDTTRIPAIPLMLIFLGMLSSQSKHFCTLSLYRSLAVVCGAVATLAAVDSNFEATALSLGVTGVLVHLSHLDTSSTR